MESSTFVQVLATLAPILAAAVVGLFALLQRQRDRLSDVEAQLSEKKRDAYLALLDPIFQSMRAKIVGGQSPSQAELLAQTFDAHRELILYGSDSVLREYQAWQQDARQGFVDFPRLGRVIVAIRRDMGHPKTSMTEDDMLRPFITDYDRAKGAGELRQKMK